MLAIGTFGYMSIEGWGFPKALYFTIITITTVGYGDYGLTDWGMYFSAALLVGGLGVFTYSFSQLAPIIFNVHAAQERRMKQKIRKLSNHFIICGLGRVGQACCRSLAMKDVPFVCIDPNQDRINEAIERGHLALCGDATDDDTLAEAGVQVAQGVACLTCSDTENIVVTLSVRELNPDLLIISRADDLMTFPKLKRAGATRVISPIHAGGENIASSLVDHKIADILIRNNLSESGIEFVELTVQPDTSLIGMTIRECEDRHDHVVFVAIYHPNTGPRIHPEGDEVLGAGDVLIAAGNLESIHGLQEHANGMRTAA
ncbi:MAG: potassium channel protein [Planctomycetota bacterium]|nr:potassium channel protein [Planctomycetota bacterium]